jgi:hypothetical protein
VGAIRGQGEAYCSTFKVALTQIKSFFKMMKISKKYDLLLTTFKYNVLSLKAWFKLLDEGHKIMGFYDGFLTNIL